MKILRKLQFSARKEIIFRYTIKKQIMSILAKTPL